MALLNNNNIFNFKIKKELCCYKCNHNETKLIYFGPFIQFNIENLNLTIIDCLEKRFQNLALICPKCGGLNGTIVNNFATYAEIIKELYNPDFISIIYDLEDNSDNNEMGFKNLNSYKNSIIKQTINF